MGTGPGSWSFLYGQHIQQTMDQPGMVVNLAHGQLNRKTCFFPCHRSRLRIWSPSRDRFGCPVPRQPAHSPLSGRIWCLLTGFLPLSTTTSTYIYRQPPSGQSRVNPATQLRPVGVHCRQSTGTGPVVREAVPVTGAALSGFTMGQFLCASLFTHPL